MQSLSNLPIKFFRGFTSKHANQVLIQPGEDQDLVNISLNNCQGNYGAGADADYDRAKVLAHYATEICTLAALPQVRFFSVSYWKMPSQDCKGAPLKTKREQQTDSFNADLMDRTSTQMVRYLGVIVFHSSVPGSAQIDVDIRLKGIESGCLRLIPGPNWASDGGKEKLESAWKRASRREGLVERIPAYADMRLRAFIGSGGVFQKRYFQATVPVSPKLAGLVIGKNKSAVSGIEVDCNVDIACPSRGEESIFVVRGVEECEVQDAIDRMWFILGRHQHEPLVYRIIDVTRDETIRDQFKEMKGLLLPVLVIGARSIVSYTVLVEAPCRQRIILEVEALGLQVKSTRARLPSWINGHLSMPVIRASTDYCGALVGQRGEVSCEAMGFSKGNTQYNVHALLFLPGRPLDSGSNRHDCINVDILSKGICKLMQAARYYDPFKNKRDEKAIRSLFPYRQNLLAKSRPEEGNGLSWCKIEFEMLQASRRAAEGRLGIWHKIERHSLAPLLPTRASPAARRFIFIDNSNLWISGKHFSGEHRASTFERNKKISERYKMASHDGQAARYTPRDVLVMVDEDRQVERFVHDRHAYFASDNGWRIDFPRLLWMVGYVKDLDPLVIAGSVPPKDEEVWQQMSNVGAKRLITYRTSDGQSSSEDQTLGSAMGKAVEEMGPDDEILLFAGDRAFRHNLNVVREKHPRAKMYVVTWAHNAYHKLKAMEDPNTFFVDLDPYIDELQFSSRAHQELHDEDVALALHAGRAVTYGNCHLLAQIRALLTEQLLENKDFRLQRARDGRLFVRFTSETAASIPPLVAAYDPALSLKSVRAPTSEGVFTVNRFAGFESDSAEEDEECSDREDDNVSVGGDDY